MKENEEPFAFGEMGKQAMEQAHQAVDTYFETLKKTVSSSPSGGTEFGEKMKSYAEKNIAATHEFVKQLGQAKDFQDILRIQAEFTQTQLSAFWEQIMGAMSGKTTPG